MRAKLIFGVLFVGFSMVACTSATIPASTKTATPAQTSTPAPPPLTATPTIGWILATPLDLSFRDQGEIVSILEQFHPYPCIENGYNLLTLTPPPIELHLPPLVFTEISTLPEPNPSYTNERADNIDKSRTASVGCQPRNCGKLYVADNQIGKFYEIDFGATTDRPLNWLQWINSDTVTVTQQGHLWINIVAINVEKQQFEYYGMIPGCPLAPTP